MIIEFPYDRERAVEYAKKWALSRNPLFFDFTGRGGNCTNFVSQCLLAGSGVMDFTPTFGWYFRSSSDRAPAWTSVESLFDFLTDSGDFAGMDKQGPFALPINDPSEIEQGDVIQLADPSGDFYHTLIISGFTDDDILVCAQSDNALDRPLSTYPYSSLRILHILGVALNLPLDNSFLPLINGTDLRSVMAVDFEV